MGRVEGIGLSDVEFFGQRKAKRRAAGRLCPYCEKPMNGNRNGRHAASIDHRTPRSRGGSNDGRNKLVACRRCNEDKGSLTVEEYLLVRRGRASRIDVMTSERRMFFALNPDLEAIGRGHRLPLTTSREAAFHRGLNSAIAVLAGKV